MPTMKYCILKNDATVCFMLFMPHNIKCTCMVPSYHHCGRRPIRKLKICNDSTQYVYVKFNLMHIRSSPNMQSILSLLPNTSEDGNKTETLSILRIDLEFLDEETN